MSRRAETQILCNRVNRQLEPFDERLERISVGNAVGDAIGRDKELHRRLRRHTLALSGAAFRAHCQCGGGQRASVCRHRGAGAPRRGRGSAPRPATALRAAEGRSTLAGSRPLRAGARSFERAPPASSGRPGRVPRFERADAAGDSLSEMSASKGETTNLISESLCVEVFCGEPIRF